MKIAGTQFISIHVLREEDDSIFSSKRSGHEISIHVLREEDDEHIADRYILVDVISIHVLREEDDLFFPVLRTQWLEFLSTSSARRTTV